MNDHRDSSYDPGCVFCRIVAGEEPAAFVYTDDEIVAFLDARPLFAGHTLVVPRAHVVTLADAPLDMLGPLVRVVQRVSAAMPEALGVQGTFVAENNVVSQSVPHLHWHVVPRTKGDGLRGFFWPRSRYESPEQAEEIAGRLRDALALSG
jgi:histidine triad (HIT) family protein